MKEENKDELLNFALLVADKKDVDWDTQSPDSSEMADTLGQLKILGQLAKAFESKAGPQDLDIHDSTLDLATYEEKNVLFHWGHLRVLELIGEGGYGEVFRAFDTMLDRHVALKLRRPSSGSDGVRNKAYIEEARRLARVRQANVLAVHGADLFDGRVGLWSELLSGETLASRLKTRGSMTLSEVQRVALGLSRALTAVHAAGLVHGDVKPSNVMIEKDDRVVLMDFGSGTKIEPEKADGGQIYGTPLVMAPELFSGEHLGPACDMYSLGVLLFRLLSGRYPIEAKTVKEIIVYHERKTCPKMGKLDFAVPKPLIQLVEQLLDPVPENRPSAHEAREKLEWIADIPRRRAKKIAVGTIIGALTVGFLTFMFGFFNARAAERNTKLAFERETTVNDFLYDTLASASPLRQGKNVKIVEALDAASAKLDTDFDDRPEIKATLYHTIGNTFGQIGEHEKAIPLLQKGLALWKDTVGEEHQSTLNTWIALAKTMDAYGDPSQAEKHFRTVIELAKKHSESDDKQLVEARIRLANALSRNGQHREAENLLNEAMAARQGEAWFDDEERILGLLNMGNLCLSQGKYHDAEAPLKEVIEVFQTLDHEQHFNCKTARSSLAVSYVRQGKLELAEKLYREDLDHNLETLGTKHTHTIGCIQNLGNILYEQGKIDEAAHFGRWALDLNRQNLGEEHPDTLMSMGNLANAVREQGKLDEAERLLEKTVDGYLETLGEKHPYTLMFNYNLAELLNIRGRYKEAERLSRETWEAQKTVMGEEHHFTLESLDNLGVSLGHLGQTEDAEKIHRQVLEAKKRVLGPENPYTLNTVKNLADILLTRGKTQEAETTYRQLLEDRTRVLGPDHPATLDSIRGLIKALENGGKREEANELKSSLEAKIEALEAQRKKVRTPYEPQE